MENIVTESVDVFLKKMIFLFGKYNKYLYDELLTLFLFFCIFNNNVKCRANNAYYIKKYYFCTLFEGYSFRVT